MAEQRATNAKDGWLRHVSTANWASDLDRIRAAHGEERTSFVRYSYWTAFGAEETFPDFAKWAAARHRGVRPGHTLDEVRRTFFTLAERARRDIG